MIKMSDGRIFETESEYFASLGTVIAASVARVQAAVFSREVDEMKYPQLNIQNWSWKSYERWKEGEKVRN